MGGLSSITKNFIILLIIPLSIVLIACDRKPPQNHLNICDIFREKTAWHDDALAMQKKWKIPIYVPMAMMFQESSYRFDAKPPMQYWLGFVPKGRSSNAYGFAQAKVATWLDYVKETDNNWSSRDDFSDALDFMAWYIHKTEKINHIDKTDAYNQYLNYHEGWGGFKNKSYQKKPWLKKVAKKVSQRSNKYQQQYKSCYQELIDDSLWFF